MKGTPMGYEMNQYEMNSLTEADLALEMPNAFRSSRLAASFIDFLIMIAVWLPLLAVFGFFEEMEFRDLDATSRFKLAIAWLVL